MGSLAGIFVGFMFFIIPVIIITIIVIAIVRKNKEGEKADSFEKIVRMVYVYILLIAFLFMTVGSIIYAFNSAIDYFIPESQITNTAAAEKVKTTSSIYPDYYNDEIQKLQEENNLRNEKNRSLTDLATAIAMAVVAVPMFIYHGKLARELK